MIAETETRLPDTETVWRWLDEVPDPEIPVLSVLDLGIVRDVWIESDGLVVVMTPTYSGCPAIDVIRDSLGQALEEHRVRTYRIETRLAPAWTTDWLSERGRKQLREYGIAPPGNPAEQIVDISQIGRQSELQASPACPHCASDRTTKVSQFGSTPCKAHYRCLACREPFDYFKPY